MYKLQEELFKLQDREYQEFQKKLCPGTENIIGIRVPKLREFAKQNKDIDLKLIGYDYYEEIMLRGMIIGMQKELDYEQIKNFIPYIDNWAVCDVFCAGLKQVKKHKKEFLEFIKPYLSSKKEFEVRFAVIILLDYYIDNEHIDYILETLSKIDREEYYINMGIAWCYSVCFVKFYDKTLEFFKKTTLSKFIRNKSIQKALESYRITNEQKQELRKEKI